MPDPEVPLALKVQSLRKYDPNIPVALWITDFESDIAVNSLDEIWAVQNFDRVLTKSALSWWRSRRSFYFDQITAAASDAAKKRVWTAVKEEFKKIFGGESQVHEARTKNKTIVYRPGSSPQDYVFKKLQNLTIIDPAMSDAKKFEHLVKGLPDDLAKTFTASMDRDSKPEAFLERLRSIAQFKSNATASTSNVNRPRSFRVKQEPRSNHNVQSGQKGPRNIKVCHYCKKKGHIQSECYKKADDEGRPRPPPKNGKPRSHRNRGRNSAPPQVTNAQKERYFSDDDDPENFHAC